MLPRIHSGAEVAWTSSATPASSPALTLGGYLARRTRLLALGEGGFRLGAWAMPVAGLAMLWLVAVVASLTVPEAFRGADYVVLAALALAGLWYVAVLRGRLRDGTAGLGTAGSATEKEPA